MSSSISEDRSGLYDDGSEPSLVAHDMRNVLSGIQGYISLARTRDNRDAIAQDLEGIAAGVTVLTDLVSALDRGPKMSDQAVTFDRMLRGLVATWRGTAENLGLTISAHIDPELEEVAVSNPLRLGRLIGNLVSNAVRHGANPTGDAGAIDIRARRLNQASAELAVTDRGPGLPPAIVDALAMGNDLSRDGLGGSGLMISRRLASELELDLVLRNRAGGGLAATIVVPVSVPHAGPVGEAGQGGAGSSEFKTARLDGLHILLAEDNVTNQMVARQMLEMLGATVSVVPDGAEALMALDEGGPFDLLLVDIEMPRVSGLDVIRAVRALPDARANLPVIALTAYAMPEHRIRIGDAGADGLIAKPIMGVREFGLEILSHKQRRDWATPKAVADPPETEAAEPSGDDCPVERAIYDMLAQTIGTESMSELLEKVQSDLVDVASGVERGCALQDMKLLRAKSHVLISVAGAIGAVELQRLAEKLNRAAHQEELAGIEAILPQISAAIADLIEFVVDERQRVAHA